MTVSSRLVDENTSALCTLSKAPTATYQDAPMPTNPHRTNIPSFLHSIKTVRHINASACQTWLLPSLPAIYSPQSNYFHCYCICRTRRLASSCLESKQLRATGEQLSEFTKVKTLPLNVFNICTKCRNVFLKPPRLSSALCVRQRCEACNLTHAASLAFTKLRHKTLLARPLTQKVYSLVSRLHDI